MSLAISPCHFSVAEFSFFALDYKFTTKLISHGKLFDVPRFHHIASDGPVFWQKAPLKKTSPNKLGTRNCHWKERSVTSSRIFARETMKANRRMQSQSPQWNTGGPRETRSEHRSGRSTMGYSVSGTEFTCLTIRSYAAASHPSTMTPE